MDISSLLSDPARAFVRQHQDKNPAELMLSSKSIPGIELRDLVLQVKGSQIAKRKIPTWHKNDRILYGETKALEQCSSEKTAVYKSSLLRGGKLVDLTGGLGVDCYFLGQEFSKVDYVEPDSTLCQLARNNFTALNAGQISVYNETAEAYLKRNSEQADWIYLDPDRRPNQKKTHRIQDLKPDVLGLLPKVFKHTANCMLKLSPMMDVKQLTDLFPGTHEVHAVSVKNECKELIYIIRPDEAREIRFTAINFSTKGDTQSLNVFQT